MEIRAGEHGDFTRVVLAFDSLPNWQAGRTDNGYSIVLDQGEPLVTDISRFFALIDRDRIAGVDVDRAGRRIELDLACECHAEIFELNDVRLVIDIRDGEIGPRASHEGRLEDVATPDEARVEGVVTPNLPTIVSPPRPSPRDISGGRPDDQVARPSIPIPLPPVETTESSEAAARDPNGLSDIARGETLALDVPLLGALPQLEPLPTVNTTAVDALTQQLSRAVSQGLVNVLEPTETPDSSAANTPNKGSRNFRIFTGLDRDTRILNDQAGATDRGRGCIPDRLVSVGRWGNSDSAKDLGGLRQKIVLETGAIDPSAMLELARYYILLGFGAEARFAAASLPDTLERRAILALADIVDTGRSDAHLFDGQLACPGQIALWAALARPFTRAELPISTDGILTSFSALPPHLREHLGPVLSQRLRAAGETALARAALAAVTRIGVGSIGLELTAARLELLGTRADDARAELERLAQGTNIEAVEALLELLNDAERRRVTPKPTWVDDADTLIRATEGTLVADALSIAALRGHIPLGRFDALRRALTEGRPGLTDVIRRDIAVDALSASVTDADDQTFLRTEIGLSDFAEPDLLDTSVRYAFVERFLDLALPRMAAKYLPNAIETDAELRLSAATLIALERRSEALVLLKEADLPELKVMQADLLTRLGNYPDAASLFSEIGDVEAAELQALRSGDWAWIADSGPGAISAVARAATASAPKRVGSAGDNAELIEDVGRRRAAYADLLQRTQPIVSK